MATVTLSVPLVILQGETSTLTSTFSSSSAVINYLPVVEYYYPANTTLTGLSVLATWNSTAWTPITAVPDYPAIPLIPGTAIGDKYSIYYVPYSSYSNAQPDLTYDIPLTVSNSAPTTIRARPIFLLGPTATNTGASDIGATTSITFNAVMYSIVKTFNLTTGTTQATGPSHPFTMTLDVRVADGVSITDLVVSDALTLELRPVSSLPPWTTVDPSQVILWNFGPIVGPYSQIIVLTVYADEFLYGTTTPVLAPIGPESVILVPNQASLLNNVTTLVSSNIVDIPLSPIAISKSYSLDGAPPYQGAELDYTIGIVLSDYFSMQNLVISDFLSAGQVFSTSDVEFDGLPLPLSNVVVNPVAPTLPVPPYYPTTNVIFTLPSLIYLPGSSHTLKYQTNLTGVYTPNPPLVGNEILSIGDFIINTAILTADNVPGGSVTETASARFTYPLPTPTKSFYAYNGVVGLMPATVVPGSLVTYRITLTLPVANFINLNLYDFFPAPIVDVAQFVPPIVVSGAPSYTAGEVAYGPDNTGGYSDPIVNVFLTSNSLQFVYGDNQVLPDTFRTIDLLLTVAINYQPFQPGLNFSNQFYYTSTNATKEAISSYITNRLVLGNPDLYVKKTVVDSTSLTAVIPNRAALVAEFGPVTLGPLIVAPPLVPTNPIDVPYFNALVPSNATNSNDGDVIRFAILIANTGTVPAYDVVFEEDYPGFLLNGFQLYTSSGVVIVPVVTATPLGISVSLPGTILPDDVVIFIVQATIPDTAPYCTGLVNTATVTAWSNTPGGENFVTTLGYVRTSSVTVRFTGITVAITSDLPTNETTLGQPSLETITLIFPGVVIPSGTLSITTSTDLGLSFAGILLSGAVITGSVLPVTTTPTTLLFDFGTITAIPGGRIAVDVGLLPPSSNALLVNGASPTIVAVFTPDTCNISSTYTLDIVEPNIVITKGIASITFLDGIATVNYNVTVNNAGTSTAYNVIVNDPKPVLFATALQLVSTVPAMAATPIGVPADPLIITITNEMAPGDTVILNISGTFDSTVVPGTIANTACTTYQSFTSGPFRSYGPTCSTVSFSSAPQLTVSALNHTYSGHTADYGADRGIVGAPGEVIELTYTLTVPFGTTYLGNVITTGLTGLSSISGDSFVLSAYEGPVPAFPISAFFDGSAVTFSGFPTPFVVPGAEDVYVWKYYLRISNSLINQGGISYTPITTSAIPVTIPPVANFTVVEPEVTITKSNPIPTPIISGSPIVYTVTVTNVKTAWDSSAWDVLISDIIATGIVSAVSLPGFSISSVYYPEVSGNKLLPGQSVSFNITVVPTFDTVRPFENTASVEWKSVDPENSEAGYARTGYDGPVGLNNYYYQATVSTLLIPYALSKTVITQGPYLNDQVVQFGIVVTVPSGVSPLTIADTFSGMSYINAIVVTTAFGSQGLLTNDFQGTITDFSSALPLTLTATVQDSSTYTSFLIIVNMRVTAESGTISNTAMLFDLTSTVTLTLSTASLYLIKTRLTDPVIANQPICYQIEVGHNTGSTSSAYNVTVTDTSSQMTSFLPINAFTTPPSPLVITVGPSSFTVQLASLQLGSTLLINYCIELPAAPALVGYNEAMLTYFLSPTSTVELEVDAADSYVILEGKVTILKITPTSNVRIGDLVIWNIAVANNGNNSLSNVVVMDPLPPAYFGPLEIPPSSSWVIVGANYQLTIPTIAPEETINLVLAYRLLDDTIATTYTNTASTSTVSSSATIYITATPPFPPPIGLFSRLIARKEIVSGNLKVGGNVLYKIDVTNVGNIAYIGNITLQDVPGAALSWNGTPPWDTFLSLTQFVNILPGETLSYNIGFNIISSANPIVNTVNLFDPLGLLLDSDSVSFSACCDDSGGKKRGAYCMGTY